MPQDRKQGGKSRLVITTISGAMIIAGLCLAFFSFMQGFYSKNMTLNNEEPILFERQTQAEPGLETVRPADDAILGPARLSIPKLGLDLDIGYGVSEQDLKERPGIYPQSGNPGTGNISVAGHRNAHGAPFYDLDKMMPGDEILLIYQQKTYRYLVEKVFETHSRDWSVISATPRAALTLTTCTPLHPINGHYNRLVVRAYLQDTQI